MKFLKEKILTKLHPGESIEITDGKGTGIYISSSGANVLKVLKANPYFKAVAEHPARTHVRLSNLRNKKRRAKRLRIKSNQ